MKLTCISLLALVAVSAVIVSGTGCSAEPEDVASSTDALGQNWVCPNDSHCVKSNCGLGGANLCAICGGDGAGEGARLNGMNGVTYTCGAGRVWYDPQGNAVGNSNGCPIAYVPAGGGVAEYAVTVQPAAVGEVLQGYNGQSYTCQGGFVGSGWVASGGSGNVDAQQVHDATAAASLGTTVIPIATSGYRIVLRVETHALGNSCPNAGCTSCPGPNDPTLHMNVEIHNPSGNSVVNFHLAGWQRTAGLPAQCWAVYDSVAQRCVGSDCNDSGGLENLQSAIRTVMDDIDRRIRVYRQPIIDALAPALGVAAAALVADAILTGAEVAAISVAAAG